MLGIEWSRVTGRSASGYMSLATICDWKMRHWIMFSIFWVQRRDADAGLSRRWLLGVAG